MIKILYENTEKIHLIARIWWPDAIYLNSKAGTFYEDKDIKIPYISTKEFESLQSEVMVIIGCNARANIERAIAQCRKCGYKYKMVKDVIFKNYEISFEEVRNGHSGEYEDIFGNYIRIVPNCHSQGKVLFNTLKTHENCVTGNKIYIENDSIPKNINIQVSSSFNIIHFGDEIELKV